MGRQEPKNRPRFTPEPTAVPAYASDTGTHTLVVANANGRIQARCTGGCDRGEWLTNSPKNYERIKADFDQQHRGGKS